MKYILQIFTGGWHHANYTSEQIIDRLEEILEILPAEKVIIGWNTDGCTYRKVGAYLHKRNIKMLLWLPVFSEIAELLPSDPVMDLEGKEVGSLALQEGENFAFSCPSSRKNIQNVREVYDRYFAGCGFDGIFLDKIRTQSFVGGRNGVLSCGCAHCRRIYADQGVNIEKVLHTAMHAEDYEPGTGFRFADPDTEAFFRVKEAIIAESIQTLCRHFRMQGLEVGLDLYAPLMSRFTGQNYREISKEADFIKPMMYRKTEAPAGIGYEYRLLKQSLPEAEGYPDISFDTGFLKEQLNEFRGLPCFKYPGIEVNYRKDIARTDPEYIRESVQAMKECGMDGAVLAWDVMLAPDSYIEAVIV